MARIDKLERARQEGMSYALEVARKKGIEGLEEELRMRGITGIPIGVSRSAVDKAVENIKNQTGLEYAIRMNDKDVKHKEPVRKQAVSYASRQHRRNTERSAKRIARKAKKLDTLRG